MTFEPSIIKSISLYVFHPSPFLYFPSLSIFPVQSCCRFSSLFHFCLSPLLASPISPLSSLQWTPFTQALPNPLLAFFSLPSSLASSFLSSCFLSSFPYISLVLFIFTFSSLFIPFFHFHISFLFLFLCIIRFYLCFVLLCSLSFSFCLHCSLVIFISPSCSLFLLLPAMYSYFPVSSLLFPAIISLYLILYSPSVHLLSHLFPLFHYHLSSSSSL